MDTSTTTRNCASKISASARPLRRTPPGPAVGGPAGAAGTGLAETSYIACHSFPGPSGLTSAGHSALPLWACSDEFQAAAKEAGSGLGRHVKMLVDRP